MNESYFLLLLALSSIALSDSDLSNHKENVRSILDKSRAETEDTPILRGLKNFLQEKRQNDAKDKQPVQKILRTRERIFRRDMPSSKMTATTASTVKNIGRSYYHLDPVFNSLKNRRLWQKSKYKKKVGSSSSSEIEMQFWMEDWGEQRQIQKFEAWNSTTPGDVLNMKMARPSGVPCGDHNQHDMPWGTCMRPAECDEEFRIHRGDSLCGRSQYVCCSIIDTAYDMYQAPDLSFEHDNSLTTDSEVDKGYRDTHEEKQRERLERKHEKSKKRRTKALLKKKIRHSITNIITEITKLMQRAYRNATSSRTKKTEELMEFIKKMKKQYRNDRQSLVDAHAFDILKYDIALEANLNKVRGVNQAFMTNDTFRDIIINGTVNKEELNRLQRTHPVISLFYKNRRMGGDFEPEQTGEELELEKVESDLEKEESELDKEESELDKEESELDKEESDLEKEETGLKEERSESETDEPEPEKEKPKFRDYDVEYGMLYY